MLAEITVNVEDFFWDSLMFKKGNDVWFKILLANIKDDLT